jgi:putative acetyltransferase
MAELHIRRFAEEDAAATAQIFYHAIHRGARDFYTIEQRRAWAPKAPDTPAWAERLGAQTTLVAERRCTLLGFMTLKPDGCLDLAYVAPEEIGMGVAKALYDSILDDAKQFGLERLYSEASPLARRFFERQGWTVIKPQTDFRNGVALENFLMEIYLAWRLGGIDVR